MDGEQRLFVKRLWEKCSTMEGYEWRTGVEHQEELWKRNWVEWEKHKWKTIFIVRNFQRCQTQCSTPITALKANNCTLQ